MDLASQNFGSKRLRFAHVHIGETEGAWDSGGFASVQLVGSRRYYAAGVEALRRNGRKVPIIRVGLERRLDGDLGVTASAGAFVVSRERLAIGGYLTRINGSNTTQFLLTYDLHNWRPDLSFFVSSTHGLGSNTGSNAIFVGFSFPLGRLSAHRNVDHDDFSPRTLLLQDLEGSVAASAPPIIAPPTPNSPILPPGQGGTPPGLGGATPPGQGGTPPGQGGSPPGQGGTPPGQGGSPPGQGGKPGKGGPPG